MKVRKKYIKFIVKNVFALVIGFISGFFGSGGGLLCVPVLENVCGLDAKKAHATTIAIILPISSVSSVIYATQNSFNYLTVLLVAMGVIIGGLLGAVLLKRLKTIAIKWIFIVVMLLAGVRMII